MDLRLIVSTGGTAPTTFETSVTDPLTGHTYNFSKAVQVGQYWNGEYFAVADPTATITSVTPASQDVSGRIINGLMKNPYQGQGRSGAQGFDSSPSGFSGTRGGITYDASLNIDPGVASPVTLAEGSYVKAESILSPTGETRIQAYSVLTVVPSVPAANAFRPGIRATSKALAKTTANVNWSLRRNITGFTPMAADPASGVNTIKRVQWAWAAMQESQRGYYPADGINVYGADWGDSLAARMLAFHGDYSQAQLEEVTHSIIQIGIDLIAGADDGLTWIMEEGHHIYRKFPALMAAVLLGDAAMQATVDWNTNPDAFGNDDNAFYYITQALIDNSPVPNSKTDTPLPYDAVHLGMPEWGSAVETASSDGISTPDLRASYRVLNNLRQIYGTAWAYATTGAEALCNPAMLDYMDRLAEILAGHYDDALYSTETDPPFTGNWISTPFGATRLSRYQTLRAYSARPTFVNVPEEMPAPALTAETDGTVTVNFNATNDFRSPRNATSAISGYDLRWRPVTNLTGTTTPDASVPWQVIEDITMPAYSLSGLPGNTSIRVQLRMKNAEGPGVWFDMSHLFVAGSSETRYTATVTTHNANTAPQVVKDPVVNLAILGEGEVARCDPGIWVGNPVPTISYQWQRLSGTWQNISGATSQTYTVAAADVGTEIRCNVTASNAAGSTSQATASRAISASPATTYSPTIDTSLFTPKWFYASRILSGSGFIYGQSGAGLLVGSDGILRLNEIGGANLDYIADVDVLMEFEFNNLDRTNAQIVLRGGGDNNDQGYILGYQRATSSGSTDIYIKRVQNGVITNLVNPGTGAISANSRRRLRVQAVGTTLRAKVWSASASEPVTWGASTTDAAFIAGFIGVIIPQQTITRIYDFDVTPL